MAELFTVGQARAAFWVAFRQVAPEAFDELAELAPMAKEAAGGSGLIQPEAAGPLLARLAEWLERWNLRDREGAPAEWALAKAWEALGLWLNRPGWLEARQVAEAPRPRRKLPFPVGSKTPEEVLECWYDLVEQAHRDGKAVNDLLVELPGPRPWAVAPWYVGPPPENRPPIEGETEAEWLDVHVKALKAYWREVERARRADGATGKAGSESLGEHVRWVALFIAGPVDGGRPGWSYSRIRAEILGGRVHVPASSTVSSRVQELLEVLDLATPQRRGGRPREPRS